MHCVCKSFDNDVYWLCAVVRTPFCMFEEGAMVKIRDRRRAARDIKRFFATKRLGIYLAEEGAEVAREYVKLFEESSK